MRIVILVITLTLLALASPRAQSVPPALGEVDALRIRIHELTLETLTLRLRAAEADARAFVASLQKPGYTLQRAEDGTWRYVAVAPPKERQ